VNSPDVQVVPAVLGVLRNAFVQAIASGFSHVPPKTAEKKEGFFRQAIDAFKKGEGPPEAQPTKQEEDKGGGEGDQRQGRRAGRR
jgi:hypothetical protein